MNKFWVKQFLPTQTFRIVCGVLLGMLAMQAVAKPAETSARDKAILLMPSANPYALPANQGKATVRFSVQMVGKNILSVPVQLRRLDDKKTIAMNDLGKEGDLVARDGIYGVNVQIDTAKVKADSCLYYEASTQQKRGKLKSPPLKLCVSSFPIGIAPVNITNPAKWGDDTRAAADEVLITVAAAINAATIRELARSINAKVAGSILPLNFYQLKLPAPASPDQLLAKVVKLRKSPGVASASVNLLGQGALNVNDAAFDLGPTNVNSQHGLKLVLDHNPPSDAGAANAWDGNNRGAGIKVVVMDTGLDLTHPDLPDTWTCQLIPPDPDPLMNPTVLSPCTATAVGTTVARHGTLVAGVIAASASIGGAEGSGEGIAGVAFNSTIHSMKMPGFDLANMTQAFQQAAIYRGENANALVYNASFNVLDAFAPVVDVTALCGAINSLVLSGTTPRAIVVNSAGNNNSSGWSYPGRCNDPIPGAKPATDALSALGKPLLITVANSVSFLTNDCGNGVGSLPNNCGTGVAGAQACIDQLCRANLAGGTPHLGSNYGTWVDIAAPGSEIRSTTIVGTGDGGGNYVSETGTTMAAPFVSGAAAILLSCGVPLSGVENALKTSAIVPPVPFPDGTSWKRLDIKAAVLANCNQPPETNPGSGSGVEDASSIPVALSGSDVGGSVASFQITSLPANGALFSDAGLTTAIAMSGTVSATANTATVYFVPNNNFNGSTTFNYASIDNLGMADATPAIAAITVTAVNDAPSFVKGADQTVPEDAGAQSVPGWATSISAGPADEALQTLNFSVTGNTNSALFSVQPAIDPAGGLAYTPATNANGSATITVVLTDGGGTTNGGVDMSTSQSFIINVTAVNDTPSFVKGADQSVLEDSGPQTVPGWATGMSMGPTNEATQTLSFILSDSALFSTQPEIDSVTGSLTYTPAPGATGSATITVELMDTGTTANGGVDTSAPQTFVITLTHKLMGIPSINPLAPVAPAQRHVSDVLTSVTSGMSDADCPPPPLANNPGISDGLCTTGPCSLGYQWMASDTFAGAASAIPGTPSTPGSTSNSTFTLRTSEVGKFMSLCVSTGMGPNCSQQCSANDAVDVGDPHITTVDGLHYDFQSEGEFVALRGANGMEIQTRQTAVSTAPPLADSYTGLTSGASVNSAVAARVGKYRVTYQPDTSPNAVAGTFVLRVDGVPTTLPVDGIDLGDGGRVISQPSASGIQIDFPDQTTLMINNNWGTFYGASWLHVSVFHTSAYEGIMGARSKGSWLPRLPNGSALGAMPAALHERYVELYVKFADSWRVNKETTLFDYDKGTSTETFTNKAWPTENGPYNAGPGPVAKPLRLKAAQLACRDVVGKNEKADCIFDVRVMGRVEIAKGHLLTQKIRTGLTAIFVRDDRDVARDKEVVTFTATVARHAAIARMEFGRKGVPTGTVQFTLNGKKIEKPIKLNAKGQAIWRVSRQKVEKQLVGAQYIPAKGSVFLPSRTLGTARLPVDVKK